MSNTRARNEHSRRYHGKGLGGKPAVQPAKKKSSFSESQLRSKIIGPFCVLELGSAPNCLKNALPMSHLNI